MGNHSYLQISMVRLQLLTAKVFQIIAIFFFSDKFFRVDSFLVMGNHMLKTI